MKKTILLSFMLVLFAVSSAWAALVDGYSFIRVANDNGAKYAGWDMAYTSGTLPTCFSGHPDKVSNGYQIKLNGTQGTNELGISSATTGKSIISETSSISNPTGSFYITNNGGRGFDNNIILMAAVTGPISNDFSLHITSTGYDWIPAAPGIGNPLGVVGDPRFAGSNTTYTTGIDETFHASDFIYGPQATKPGGLPLYVGQNTADPSTASSLMFIDLYVGNIKDSLIAGLTDNGAVKVDFSLTGLYAADLAFNALGWCSMANQGEGLSWTNLTNGASGSSGYLLNGTATAPAPVPLPATLLLLGSGLSGLGILRRTWEKS